jgi:hypothetical protein
MVKISAHSAMASAAEKGLFKIAAPYFKDAGLINRSFVASSVDLTRNASHHFDDFGRVDLERRARIPGNEYRPQRIEDLEGVGETSLTQNQRNARAGAHDRIRSMMNGMPNGAPRTVREVRDVLPHVNPTRGQTNCIENSMAVDDILRGRPAVAGPSPAQSTSARLEHRTVHSVVKPNVDQAERELLDAGPGSRAIITGQWPNGMAHALNMANLEGRVVYIDGEINEMSTALRPEFTPRTFRRTG